MSIVILGTHIFEGIGNDVDVPLSGQLSLGFNQNNELSVKNSDGDVWQIGGVDVVNKLIKISSTGIGINDISELTAAMLATHINSLLITAANGQNYYFEVSDAFSEKRVFILRENTPGIINITSNDLILLGGGNGGASASVFITKTKNEIDQLILTNGLLPGTLYKITNVHPSLYNDSTNSGTTVYLLALTTNVLSKTGHGEFWNPKYDQSVSGFGIYDNYNRGIFSSIASNFYISTILGITGTGPVAMILDSLGNIYTVNSGSNDVTKITPAGITTIYGTSKSIPESLIFDSIGNLYIVHSNSTDVSKITSSGTTSSIATTGIGPNDIAIDSLGNIYTANSGSNDVTKVTPDGTTTTFATTGTQPSSIIIDSVDNIYITNRVSNNVTKITPGGISTILGSTSNSPESIVIDSLGNIYTANSGSNNVTKITPGGISTILGSTGTGPVDIAIDSLGNIYTANSGSNNVTKITPGGISTILGSTGIRPFSIVIDSLGNFYTANNTTSNISKLTSSSAVLPFQYNEAVTTDTGATGTIVNNIKSGLFLIESGDWSTSTKIIGNYSKAEATISNIDIKTYNASNKVFWGGYSWTNNNGIIGKPVDVLTLDNNWTKNTYSTINYNKVIDVIVYDYDNDRIVRRYEVEANNDVITNVDGVMVGMTIPSPIAVFMFGNKYNDLNQIGLTDNKVYNSYFENINSRSEYIKSNTLTNYSLFFSNIFIGGYFSKNTLNNSAILETVMDGGSIHSNVMNTSYFKNNTLSNSSINKNILNNSEFWENVMITNSEFSLNALESQSLISMNILESSVIITNSLHYSSIQSNELSYSEIVLNELSSNSRIYNNNLNSGYIQSNVLTNYSNLSSNTVTQNSSMDSNHISNSSRIQNNTIENQSNLNYNMVSGNSDIVSLKITYYSGVIGNTLVSSSFLGLGLQYPIDSNKTIHTLHMENATITGDISLSTIFFADGSKTAYKRPDGVTKIRYYDNSDALVIADITD